MMKSQGLRRCFRGIHQVSLNEWAVCQRRHAPYKIAGVVEALREQGVCADRSLTGTELTPDELYHPETLTSFQQYLIVCSNAVQMSNDPAISFRVGTKLQLSLQGIFGSSLLCSPTLRDYFQLSVRYQELSYPTLCGGWEENSNDVLLNYPHRLDSEYPVELYRFLMEVRLAEQVAHVREVLGKSDIVPRFIKLSYPTPRHASLYREFLKCDCSFNESVSQLGYSARILEKQPALAHRPTSLVLQETCNRIIGQSTTLSGVAGEVHQIIASTAGHSPSMATVATTLLMTVRTLHRRLEAEGTSFAAISADVRCMFAKRYLRTSGLGVEDISEMLGFSDAANFRHAFRRWTGSTPSRYRPRAS